MSKDLSRLYHQHITYSKYPPPPMPNSVKRYRDKYANYLKRESEKPPMPKVIRDYRKSVKNYNDHMALECKKLGYVKLRRGLRPKTRKRNSNKRSSNKSNYHYREVNLNKP